MLSIFLDLKGEVSDQLLVGRADLGFAQFRLLLKLAFLGKKKLHYFSHILPLF